MVAKAVASPIHHLIRSVVEDRKVRTLPDPELLERFRAQQDQAAFHALLRRHGPMVLDVCRSVLGNEADAEDAFQATFLVFARKAGAIRKTASLVSWLHGVAHRTALKARARSAIRQKHEGRAPVRQATEAEDRSWREVRQALHEELGGLPERYRTPLALCYLQGATQEAAAVQLKLAKSTLREHLERGRSLLRTRLLRRGLGPAALLVAAAWPGSVLASVPTPLINLTARAALLLASGQAIPSSLVGANVASLTQAMTRTLSMTKLKMLTLALFVLTVIGTGLFALQGLADPPQIEAKQPDVTAETKDQRATRLAVAAHAQAAAIDKLPRFCYQVRYRYGPVDPLRAVDVSLDQLRQGLTAPVRTQDWFGRYERGFAWDEKRFINELRPGESDLSYSYRFGTATDAWDRSENKAKTSVNFVRSAGLSTLWNVPDHPAGTSVILFDFSYLRLTPHRYWWGQTVVRTSHTMSFIPLEKASWKHLGTEKIDSETCDVVESSHAESAAKGQRLWIGQDSGRVRAVLSYLSGPQPNELAQFDDYREVSPGVWLPFREVRTFPHSSETVPGKRKIIRSELVVEMVLTGLDLSKRYASLLPKEGDRVQDQRFATPVDYHYRATRTDDEVRKQAEAKHRKQLKGQEEFQRMVQPIAAMVGKQAPVLPAEGWVGGKRPDVAGKPYLVQFWATWCGPCKSDMPLLKTLAEDGLVVVGMHPTGTPSEEVEKVIRERKLGYPTFLDTNKAGDAKRPIIADYPVGVFPYYILVDAQGKVAAHGFLADLLGALKAARKSMKKGQP